MEKNKLEIKHLAPYLPYGLKVYHKPSTWELVVDYTDKNTQLIIGTALKMDIKPILRPLSDLIVSTGEFNPIFELTKIAVTQIWGDSFKLNINNVLSMEDEWGLIGTSDTDYRIGFTFSSDSPRRDFKLSIDNREMILDKLALFNKLFEWHFDVFGLIEKGLAIDINTLENGI